MLLCQGGTPSAINTDGRRVSQGTRRITSQERSCRDGPVAMKKGKWNSSWATLLQPVAPRHAVRPATAGSVQAAQVCNEAETGSGQPPV